jgi:hypothetical protein
LSANYEIFRQQNLGPVVSTWQTFRLSLGPIFVFKNSGLTTFLASRPQPRQIILTAVACLVIDFQLARCPSTDANEVIDFYTEAPLIWESLLRIVRLRIDTVGTVGMAENGAH